MCFQWSREERTEEFGVPANDYGQMIEYSGPVYQSMLVDGNKVHLHFTHIGAGLIAKDGGPLRMFTIAGPDRKFVWADAIIQGNEVVVSSKDIPAPVAVRYAWLPNPEGLNFYVAVRYAWLPNPEGLNFYNKDGLPAIPFRTDDWPEPTMGVWW